MGSHLAQAGNADVDSASQQPDAGAAERPASSGISAEAKAAAEEESRKRAENYEKAQQAQKRRMAEQAEAKARSEAKARTSTPPKYVQPKPMPAKSGPVPSKAKPVPAKPMPAPPPMPKHVAWFLANSTVSCGGAASRIGKPATKGKSFATPSYQGGS